MSMLRFVVVVVVVVLFVSHASAAANTCAGSVGQNTEHVGVPNQIRTGVPDADTCCSLCSLTPPSNVSGCDTWTYYKSHSTCEMRHGNPGLNMSSTCGSSGECTSGVTTCAPARTYAQLIDYTTALVVTAENFSAWCYLFEHQYPSIGSGFWLDDAAPAVLQKVCGIDQAEYDEILAGRHSITEFESLQLADWMIDELYKQILIQKLAPGFETFPLPIQAVILDISYCVGPAGLKAQFMPMLACASAHDWTCMLRELKKTVWFGSHPARAPRDAIILEQFPSWCNVQLGFEPVGFSEATSCDHVHATNLTVFKLTPDMF